MISTTFGLDAGGFFATVARINGAMGGLKNIFIGSVPAMMATQFAAQAVSAAFQGIKQSMDLGGELSDIAANTGQSVSDLVVLRQALQNAGVGADKTQDSIAKLQRSVAGLNEDGESTAEAFDALKLSQEQLRGMSAMDQFRAISAAMQGIDDESERTAIAMRIFGRTGAEMMALFRDPAALDVAARQTGRLGETMEKNAGRFDAASDAIGALGLKVTQFWAGFTGELADAGGLIDMLNDIDLTTWGQEVGRIVNDVAFAFRELGEWIQPVLKALGLLDESGTKRVAISTTRKDSVDEAARKAEREAAREKREREREKGEGEKRKSDVIAERLARVGGGGRSVSGTPRDPNTTILEQIRNELRSLREAQRQPGGFVPVAA